MRLWTMFGVSALLLSCGDKEGTAGDSQGVTDTQTTDTYNPPTDADGDGYAAEEDCDDSNPDIHPGQPEECNGVDENCNDLIDEGFSDTDGDLIADCMDVEECDGLDNDGDGQIDEDFADTDGDGEANCGETEACNGIDDDGDGQIDEDFDVDGDGYTSCGDAKTAADCDDSDASVNPGASETDGDGIDNDCDGAADEGAWRIGDLIITEVMVNPHMVLDPNGEWFEIFNDSGRDVDINGMIIGSTDDGDRHQISSPDPIIIPDQSFAVIANNADSSTNGGVTAVYGYGGDVSMANETDDLWLQINGLTIDQIRWDDGGEYPDPSGASLALDPDFFSSSLNDLSEGWCQAIRPWGERTDMGYPNDPNYVCRPIANGALSTTGSIYTCNDFTLDASASESVPDTDIYYSWELVSAPSGSATTTDDIENADEVVATFMPDEPGTYTFTVTVNNGYEYSEPDTVTVTVTERPTNNSPAADAGPDQTYSETSVCSPISYGAYYSCAECAAYEFELDGTGSSDADGDWFTYDWAITDGSGYATIDDETTEAPTVTVSGVTTTYGTNTTAHVEVTLTTTDCMGATGSDAVDLYYTCRGS